MDKVQMEHNGYFCWTSMPMPFLIVEQDHAGLFARRCPDVALIIQTGVN